MEKDTSARDVFMYALVVITMGMSAGNLGTLLFQYINLYVPDPTAIACIGTSCREAIRYSLASIIVVFPVFLWVWRFLQRDIVAHPEKGDARIRRWLLYLTLFVAGGFLIGDTVSLIFTWLQGSFTLQFMLKVLAIFYIAGTVFYYFLKILRQEISYTKIVGFIAIGVIIASIIVGFVASGSPFRVRLERLDERRLGDLQSIQNQIVSVYWQSKGALPVALSNLEDSISGFVVPTDPETRQSYEYAIKGERSFKLCATFDLEGGTSQGSIEVIPYGVYGKTMNSSWTHDAGRVCFDRTIDPQLYPVKSPLPL